MTGTAHLICKVEITNDIITPLFKVRIVSVISWRHGTPHVFFFFEISKVCSAKTGEDLQNGRCGDLNFPSFSTEKCDYLLNRATLPAILQDSSSNITESIETPETF